MLEVRRWKLRTISTFDWRSQLRWAWSKWTAKCGKWKMSEYRAKCSTHTKNDQYKHNSVINQQHNEWNASHESNERKMILFSYKNGAKIKNSTQKHWPYIVSNLVASMPPLSTPHKCINCVNAIKIVREQTKSKLVTSESNTDSCRMRSHAADELTRSCSSLSRSFWSFARNTISHTSNSLSTWWMVGAPLVAFAVVARWYASPHMNSPVLANGAVNMMHAMNQAAGILHRNISRTLRRCHGPQLPISVGMSLDDGCVGGGNGFSNASIMANLCMLLSAYSIDTPGQDDFLCKIVDVYNDAIFVTMNGSLVDFAAASSFYMALVHI